MRKILTFLSLLLVSCNDTVEFDPIEQQVIFEQTKKRIYKDLDKRKPKMAEKRFDSIVFKNENNFEYNHLGAVVRHANGRKFEAAQFLEKALSIEEYENVYMQLAKIYKDDIGDSAKYILIIRKLMNYFPAKYEYQTAYAEHFAHEGIYSMAITYGSQAIRLAPVHELPDLYVKRGNYRIKENDIENAISDCDSAIAIDSNFCLAYIERTTWLLNDKQLKKALKSAEQGLKRPCNKGSLYYRRAIAKYQLNDILGAKSDILKALELKNPEAINYIKNNADIRFKMMLPQSIYEKI